MFRLLSLVALLSVIRAGLERKARDYSPVLTVEQQLSVLVTGEPFGCSSDGNDCAGDVFCCSGCCSDNVCQKRDVCGVTCLPTGNDNCTYRDPCCSGCCQSGVCVIEDACKTSGLVILAWIGSVCGGLICCAICIGVIVIIIKKIQVSRNAK